ncbi:putative DnaJ domain, Chaperone J-domain superfamily [Helianthus annuus]|nr:putative DnaJ domain, Chaperone J-domain superfamily [Helianthus annuus]
MECNKEEAVRAKQLAEKKMEIKDFSGALKIALKAQQLYPELENISQLILVCEVHCSAEKKSYGTDKDWYGILKVEASADDITIKKQYRKLALTLHPDKNNFSYKENVNDIDIDIDNDDVASPNENSAEEDTFWKEEARKVDENKQKESDNEKTQKDDEGGESANDDDKGGESANDDDNEEEIEPEVFECPDPEFSDFDQYRKEESFKTGQIWACYDTEDAMPRFYTFIKKVSLVPEFKLQIQWLKPDPATVDEKKWVAADLPVACGRFKHGKLDKSEDIFSFSHLVTWEAGQQTKTINIIPRKGETWALFKNWSINWHTPEDDDEERKYEYEFVEVLSDFDENVGARVSLLEKVKGFVCLFSKKEGGEMVVSGSEKYRFAHMVLSCRMSGEEREGVPKGCYELDPASLPASTFE